MQGLTNRQSSLYYFTQSSILLNVEGVRSFFQVIFWMNAKPASELHCNKRHLSGNAVYYDYL